MQALMLAAGLGKRLAKYTKNNTKCMVEVAGEKLIDRAIKSIKKAGIKRFVLVTGYKGKELQEYILSHHKGELDFVFIDNDVYSTTNNIYSFYLAKDELVKDDTILLESDIIFDEDLIKEVKESEESNTVVVAKYESWMDGTVVTLTEDNHIHKFVEKQNMKIGRLDQYYKTVNVYKFSKEFLANVYLPFLKTYMDIQGFNAYYETSLKYICQLPNISMKAFLMDERPWYEIDDAQDLNIANILFSKGEEKYNLLTSTYGGFWRYPGYIDFCYLVNPYFPKQNMIEKMQNEFPILLRQYPSGLKTQNMNASRTFNVNEEYLLVGNGAAELINALGRVFKGKKVAVNLPTFNEYVRCFKECQISEIDNSYNDYALSKCDIRNALNNNDAVIIVNPENPSGYMFDKDEIIELCDYAKEVDKVLVIDESFEDFAKKERRYTLLDDSFLEKYPNVIVVKSISKSFGVPGLRLGVLASSDKSLLKDLKEEMQVWNINSFGEYYLQVYNLYSKDYLASCDLIAEQREYMISELRKIKGIKVYDSEANYVMVDLGNTNSKELCINLLDNKKIIIKDLSTKNKFNGRNFIRLAVRDQNDNDLLLNELRKYLIK